ncbi:hypothetical protein, partial [Paraburkholderia sp. SG-MS1]|uniref:hypothetical protein n=1 Tax=Paraburkholderia sp. SG-MS1 TaxID=2023741 RepID=UPI001EEB8345
MPRYAVFWFPDCIIGPHFPVFPQVIDAILIGIRCVHVFGIEWFGIFLLFVVSQCVSLPNG